VGTLILSSIFFLINQEDPYFSRISCEKIRVPSAIKYVVLGYPGKTIRNEV
jgi:hypothetical protein